MKKLTNVIALFILVSVNVLTPISYAQETPEVEEVSPVIFSQEEEQSGEKESIVNEETQELVEDLPEILEDDAPSLIDMVVDTVLEDIDKSFDNEVEEEEEWEDGVSDSMLFVGNVDEPQIKVAANGDSITSGCYTYTIIDGENKQIEITQYSGNSNCPKFIDLSNGIDWYDVISIGYRAFYEKWITWVVLWNTVEYVWEQAFLDWNAQLKLLNIWQNVRYLWYDAFHLYYYVWDNAYYTDVKFEEWFNIADLQISGWQYNRNWFIIKWWERGCFLFDVQKNEINGYLCDDAIIIVPEEIYGLTVKSIYWYRGNGQGGAFSNTSSRLAILPPTIDNIWAAAACPYVSGIASVEDVSELEVQWENDLSLWNHYVWIKPYTWWELSQLITNEMLSDACMYISEEHIVRFYDEDWKFIKAITVEWYIDNEDYPEVNDKDWLHWKRFDSDGKLYQGEPIISDLNLKLWYVWVIHHEDLWIIEVHWFNDTMYIKDKNEWAVNLWDAWNYYFWWNNKWVNSVDLQESSSYNYTYGGREIVNMSDLDEGFLEWWKMSERNTWWEEWKTNNPCDVNKWEYLPTPEDWVNLMNIWANMNGDILDDARNREWRYEVSSLWTLTGTIWFRNYGSYFNEDMLIPYVQHLSLKSGKLWKIYWSMLWTSRDGLWSIWWYYVSEWELGRSNSYLDGEAYPVRCFVAESVTVTFDFWDDVIVKNVFKWKTIERLGSTPTKAWYTLEGWYTQAGTKWDFEQDRVEEDMTLYAKWRFCWEWFTVKSNRCVPDDMDMEWIIEVSDWEDTIYLKDRNEGADRKYDAEKLQVLYDCDDNAISNEDFLSCVNDGLWTSFNDSDDVYDYWDDLEDSIVLSLWTYYFRWNNSGVNYDELEFEDENNYSLITNMEDLNEKFLEWWKLWNSEWDGWVEWKEQNNPCDWDREYLPTPGDWTRLMTIWANKNGYQLTSEIGVVPIDDRPRWDFSVSSLWQYSLHNILVMSSAWQLYFPSIEAVRMFSINMSIPEAGYINYNRSSCITDDEWSSCGELYYRNGGLLWMAQNENDYVWTFNWMGVFYGSVDDILDEWWNNVAFPVRCFVDVPEVLVVTLYSDGNIYKELNVVKWGILVEPAGPNKSNHTFDWWYTEDGEKYGFDTLITEDITLYARWIENKSTWWYSGWWGSSSRPSSQWSWPSSSDVKSVDNPKDNTTDDKKEETKPEVKPVNNGGGKATSTGKVDPQQELFDAYKWAYANGLTKYANMADARLDDPLNRQEMAKISTLFATKFVDKSPNTKKRASCSQYSDLWKVTSDMEEFIIESCELGYMWYRANGVDYLERFRPYTPVSLAEFSIILSRIMWWNRYAISEKQWYQWHLHAVYENNLIDNITKPFENITRKDAYLMLYRLTKYL